MLKRHFDYTTNQVVLQKVAALYLPRTRSLNCRCSCHPHTATLGRDSTSSRSSVSATNLVVWSDADLRSATADTKLLFSCLLLWRENKSIHQSIHPSQSHSLTQKHTQGCRLHVLVQTQKVIYEVHHFCLAEFWGEFGLFVCREHDQRAAVLIKSTCTDR